MSQLLIRTAVPEVSSLGLLLFLPLLLNTRTDSTLWLVLRRVSLTTIMVCLVSCIAKPASVSKDTDDFSNYLKISNKMYN